MLVHAAGCVTLLQHTVFQHRDAVTERHRLGLVVGDVDGGHAQPALQAQDLGAHLTAQLGVEVAQRLVEQERVGLTDDGAAHGDALAEEGADGPSLLFYGHYDVQPAEPLELWDSPPFEPEFRDGRLYARGSTDDKGQLYLHIKAAEAHLKDAGSLPINLIVLAEGEEEVGSPNLVPFA